MSLLVLLAAATVGVAEALLELLHAPRGVDEALLTREERVVAGPDVNVDLGFGAVGFHHQLAVAVDLGGHHLRVNILLHKASLQRKCASHPKPHDYSSLERLLANGVYGGIVARYVRLP